MYALGVCWGGRLVCVCVCVCVCVFNRITSEEQKQMYALGSGCVDWLVFFNVL